MILQFVTNIFRLGVAVSMIPFVLLQWRVRNKNGIVKRLRHHILWETIALIFVFATSGLLQERVSVKYDFVYLFVTLGIFIAFLSGTRLFFDIYRGKYDKHH